MDSSGNMVMRDGHDSTVGSMPTLARLTTRRPSRSIIGRYHNWLRSLSHGPASINHLSRPQLRDRPPVDALPAAAATTLADIPSHCAGTIIAVAINHQAVNHTRQSEPIPSQLVIALPADSAAAAYTSQQILYVRQIVSRRRREHIASLDGV